MDLTQLWYFRAVCQYGTVTRASQALHVTQPAISSAVRNLEEEFGVILFQRHYRGMELTVEGEEFLKMSKDLLERADALSRNMINLGKKRHTLRVGIGPMTSYLLLPIVYQEHFSQHSEMRVHIQECGHESLMRKLDENDLDMALLSHSGPLAPEYRAIHLMRLHVVCCVSPEHPLAAESAVSARQLSAEKLVMFEDSFLQTKLLRERFLIEGCSLDELFQTSQLSTMINMIESNLVAGFLFDRLADRYSGIVTIPFSPPLPIDISLVWRRDSYPFPDRKRFIEYIKSHAMISQE